MHRLFQFWHRYIAVLLIFVVLVSQTIRVDFFYRAEASQDIYRDIVSVFVDRDTYQSNRTQIKRYANDIQSYLGSTQVSIYVIDDTTSVESIAAQNERLYYEGLDPDKVDRLVGVVLIGNVPLPMVSTQSDTFPSIYPYVDFVDKKFVYDGKTGQYRITEDTKQKTIEPEIWHGVINPALGREWDQASDSAKIRDFLDKTHAFYNKEGLFSPSDIPPRVFYYDGFNESAAGDQRSIFQYALGIKNSENIAYKRFTKYLLKDINTALKNYDLQYGAAYTALLKSFGIDPQGDSFDAETIKNIPDIQTQAAIDGLIRDFHAIINKKTLSDQLLAVRNSGRYSSEENVRADIAATMVTAMDMTARSTLYDMNQAIMESIDALLIDRRYAKKIPIFDTFSRTDSPNTSQYQNTSVYQNYYFGQKSTSIVSPEQCSIARGSDNLITEFGRSQLVEGNIMYDTSATEGQVNLLSTDTNLLTKIHRNSSFTCFSGSTPFTKSYWGDNSMINLIKDGNIEDIFSTLPRGTVLTGMTQSIYSLRGMKETTRFTPSSIAHCISPQYQYALENPAVVTYPGTVKEGDSDRTITCTKSNLSEWNTPSNIGCTESLSQNAPSPLRYSCISTPKSLNESRIFGKDIMRYGDTPCLSGSVSLNGNTIIDSDKSCITTEGSGEDSRTTDNTIYESVSYHTIPSLLRHVSPTDAEIAASTDPGVTPSLPVDMIRYVEFLTPKGNIARINYPNFFTAEGDDIATFRDWLRKRSKSDWDNIIAKENATTISPDDIAANEYLSAGTLPESPIDWNIFVSDEVILKIIQSRNWLTPDTAKKYTTAVEGMLSYSQNNTLTDIYGSPSIPKTSNAYEVAYLGLSSFLPLASGTSDEQDLASLNDVFRSKIRAINITAPPGAPEARDSPPSDMCGSPDGVDLFKWPSAIVCWIKSLTPMRIEFGYACGVNTIGIKNTEGDKIPKIPTTPFSGLSDITGFYTGGKLVYNLDKKTILPYANTDIQFTYQKDNSILGFPKDTQIQLELISFVDRDKKLLNLSNTQSPISINPNPTIITEQGGRFVVSSHGIQGTATLRASIVLQSTDNREFLISSDNIEINISNEYIGITPYVDGRVNSTIAVTSLTGMLLDIALHTQSGTTTLPEFPVKMSIYDEISEAYIDRDISVLSESYMLPSRYLKQTGVYRIDIQDRLGRIGSHSIAVQSGPLQRVTISPVASSILRGTDTPVIIRLRDALGNPIDPNIHSIDVRVDGGYIKTSEGKKNTSMLIDSLESEVTLSVGSDTSTEITISVTVDGAFTHKSTLSVFDDARVVLSRDGQPKIGSQPQKVILKIQGKDQQILSGFNSIAHISLPEGAGAFYPHVINIRDGISDEFEYIPGQLSGEHDVTVSVPGLGVIPDIAYSVGPGDPLYVSHREQGEQIIFSLRDRYNNISTLDMPGTLQVNTDTPMNIDFDNGIYSHAKIPGVFSLNIPGLALNTLEYTDSNGLHVLTGSQNYTVAIASNTHTFDFHDDYNARYTILAGGSFLREAEDILYTSQPMKSQSIAVTTLLDTPYVRDSVISFFPGGGFAINNQLDVLIESSVQLKDGYPYIVFRDSVTQSLVADAHYTINNPKIDTCVIDCTTSISDTSHIVVSSIEGVSSVENIGSTRALMHDGESLLTVFNNGKIQYRPGVTLHLADLQNDRGIILDIQYTGKSIARLYYRGDEQIPLQIGSPQSDTAVDAISVRTHSDYTVEHIGLLGSPDGHQGLRILSSNIQRELDTVKNGPETMDSLGLLSELPGVGWQGSNTMLLNYAGGDTVGESTRWFHTYTMVNLGDPVAHNDTQAPGTHKDGIDKTLGTQLTSSNTSSVESYVQADMNNDGYDDIVVLYTNGYVELLLNLVDRIRSRGNIAYIPDIISRGFSVADFSGDGYSDIVGVDNQGGFALIANNNRSFSHLSISVQPGAVVPTSIDQFQIRDMDKDGMDDIIYISQGGELGILYGTVTPGLYQKSILDATLGITLSDSPIITDGAIYASHIPQLPLVASTGSEMDQSQLNKEVYYPFTYSPNQILSSGVDPSTNSGKLMLDQELSTLTQLESTYQGSSSDPTPVTSPDPPFSKNYIRSEYAEAHGLSVYKTYKNITQPILKAGDTIRTTIHIENTTNTTISNLEYLDTVPKIFDASDTKDYTITLGSGSVSRSFEQLSYSDFDAYFSLRDIPAGSTLILTYDLRVLPASYGELLVGDYEQGETQHDIYGDVGFKTDTTCGADMMLWRSDEARAYTRGTRTFGEGSLPSGMEGILNDANKDGIPDSIKNTTPEKQKDILNSFKQSFEKIGKSMDIVRRPDKQIVDITFDENAVNAFEQKMKGILDGLACGFGGGSCMAFPINWAPLAPGSAPVAFGYPLSSLTPSTGLPVFSALTGLPLYGPWGCIPIPIVWPLSPIGYSSTCGTNVPGAGGLLGSDPSNVIRIYATPTLTLGAGAAFCFGQASVAGNLPPPGSWPLVNGGNCIVMAKPLSMCKDDGSASDGDVRAISGLGTIRDTWNPLSCQMQAQTGEGIEDEKLRKDIVSQLKSPNKNNLLSLYTRLGSKVSRSQSGGSYLRIGGAASGGSAQSTELSVGSIKTLGIGNIVKLKNKRIAGFPDFIMNWVSRQTDQITNSLLTPPNLIIIPPTSVGQNTQFDGSLSGFTDSMKSSFSSAKSATDALVKKTQSSKDTADSDIGKWVNNQQNNFDALQDSLFKSQVGKIADGGKGGVASIRAAYKLIGKLPLISLSPKTIPIDVPWILPQELDKYARSLDAYSRELQDTIANFCLNDPSPECALEKGRLESSGLKSTLNQNLKIIEEYKNFPVKLQKYVTWKQRYLTQVLCYITEIQQMTTGWVKDNSLRFQKWAELVVLIRAIASSWQPILDIVAQKDAQCSVCHNERYNAKDFKARLIGALIPSIPVIQFPRWPDIVLDLSDVRFGIVLIMPDFQFNLKPIRLPDLPRFSLPRAPGAGIILPTLDLLPPIPTLPDLPDLPAIPTVKLPNLPPPPKLPKLFASLSVGLKILKLFQIMECYVNKTTLVPEWTVGDVIAQRTERQGTLALDFLNIDIPQFTFPAVREIRVSSHINFDVRSEYIADYAEAAVDPLNRFNSDLGRGMPKKLGEDLIIEKQKDKQIDLNKNKQSYIPSDIHNSLSEYIGYIEKDANIVLSVDEFKKELQTQFGMIPEFSSILVGLDEKLAYARQEAQQQEKEILAYNTEKFDTLRMYIQKQYDETAHMSNIIDLLQSEGPHTLADIPIERALLLSDTMIRQSQKLAQEWNDKNTTTLDDIDTSNDGGMSALRESLSSRLSRIVATTDTPALTDVPGDNFSSGYTPNYTGIYTISEGGNQIRLFDYTAPLVGDENTTRTDIDMDGDMDYLFLLDGILYLKKSNTYQPNKILDTTIETQDIDSSLVPSAADFFHENISLSHIFSFSYDAPQLVDAMWRVEFYDQYIQWDMSQLDSGNNSTSPHIIELVDVEKLTKNKTLRVLRSIDTPSELVIEGPRMEILTGAMDFVVTPGRVLYAGDRSTTIFYSTGTDIPYVRKTLAPAEQISFSETTNVSLRSGKVFVVYPSILGVTYQYSPDILGMPIVPGVRIAPGKGGITLYDTIADRDLYIGAGTIYQLERISSLNQSYTVSMAHPNGFYFPKITRLYGDRATPAGEILFAPRASSDRSPPVVDIDRSIRIPVYQKKEVQLKDIITEMSDYTVAIDADTTQDSDANGIYDDDFSLASSGVTVTDSSVTFGPFDTIGIKNMLLKVQDEFGNITISEFSIEVYPPIPTVLQANPQGEVRGTMNEPIIGEPIDIFRIRTGMDILLMDTTLPTQTTEGGVFSNVFNTSSLSGIALTHSGISIDISEWGIVSNIPTGYTTEVKLANSTDPMHLIIKNGSGKALYRQFFVLPQGAMSIEGSKISSLNNESQYFAITPYEQYKLISANSIDPNIPGGNYVVDSKYIPMIAIARDGNIYSMTGGISATLSSKDNYPQLTVRSGDVTIANILYKFDFFYTIE